jgi:hypothetical protein
MRVISTNGTRSIKVLLREYALSNNYDTFIRNESTKEVILINTTATVSEIKNNMDFFTFDVEQEYKEGDELDFYIVEKDSDVILHRNKIYVTDQFNEETFFFLLETGYKILLENGDILELQTA